MRGRSGPGHPPSPAGPWCISGALTRAGSSAAALPRRLAARRWLRRALCARLETSAAMAPDPNPTDEIGGRVWSGSGMTHTPRFDHLGITVADLDLVADFFVAL